MKPTLILLTGLLTLSACSEAGNCVLSVATEPKIQIYLSSAAADKAGVSFSNAFMMLVKKH